MPVTVKSNKPIEEVVAAIEALDLNPIKFKLMDPEEGEGWSRATADRLEIEYKRFLTLLVKHPDSVIAPSKDVDAFWHGHILDTMKYAEDCERVFGYFLHHFPYFGMRGAEDAAALARAAETTRELLQKEFGAMQRAEAAYCYATRKADAAYCYAAKSADAAYCYAAQPATQAAYCYAARPVSQAAYCYAARPVDAAYCYAATKAEAAYCYAAKPLEAAYCYAAKPNFDFTRPKLAVAA